MNERDEESDRRLFRVAQLYYEQNLTQKEISTKLEIPQPTVSRWLEEARNQPWLKVHVEADRPYWLEDKLCTLFDLKECRIALTHEHMTEIEMGARLGRACGAYLVSLLQNLAGEELRIGLSGGTTLATMLRQMPFKTIPKADKVHLYPTLGFFPTAREIWFVNAVVIVSEMIDRIKNSVGYWLPLPPLPETGHEEMWNLVTETKLVKQLVDEVDNKLNVALMGMGSIKRREDGEIDEDEKAGRHFIDFAKSVDSQWSEGFKGNQIIGDLSFLPFSADGYRPIQSLAHARIGISWQALQDMVEREQRSVLVCGGVGKHETLYKLLTLPEERKTINVLITDIAAARYLQYRITEDVDGRRANVKKRR
jgi:DNA-binding transcriptional regulator LsrR (DeoR family)